MLDATLFALRTGNGLICLNCQSCQPYPALRAAQEYLPAFLNMIPFDAIWVSLKLSTLLGCVAILSGKEEFPDQNKRSFCLQVWGKLELGGKAPFYVFRNEYWTLV